MSDASAQQGSRQSERLISCAPVARRPSGGPPGRVRLAGDAVCLEPLDPAAHAGNLFHAGHDGEARGLWTYMPYGPFENQRAFAKWLQACATFNDPLFFVICEKTSGRPSGMASYLNVRPTDGVMEIGHIWFAPTLQRTRAATEALFLLMRRAFDELGYRRLEWKCDALNERSRRAALRLGFRFEGVFYRHMIVKNHNRDTAWYSIIDEEWPYLREGFERWLAAENFDEHGRQRQPLQESLVQLYGGRLDRLTRPSINISNGSRSAVDRYRGCRRGCVGWRDLLGSASRCRSAGAGARVAGRKGRGRAERARPMAWCPACRTYFVAGNRHSCVAPDDARRRPRQGG